LHQRLQVARQAGDEAVSVASVCRLRAAGRAGQVAGTGLACHQHIAIAGQRQRVDVVAIAAAQVAALLQRLQVARQAGDEAVTVAASVCRLRAAGRAGQVAGIGGACHQHLAIAGQRQRGDVVGIAAAQVGALDQRVDGERVARVVRGQHEAVVVRAALGLLEGVAHAHGHAPAVDVLPGDGGGVGHFAVAGAGDQAAVGVDAQALRALQGNADLAGVGTGGDVKQFFDVVAARAQLDFHARPGLAQAHALPGAGLVGAAGGEAGDVGAGCGGALRRQGLRAQQGFLQRPAGAALGALLALRRVAGACVHVQLLAGQAVDDAPVAGDEHRAGKGFGHVGHLGVELALVLLKRHGQPGQGLLHGLAVGRGRFSDRTHGCGSVAGQQRGAQRQRGAGGLSPQGGGKPAHRAVQALAPGGSRVHGDSSLIGGQNEPHRWGGSAY